MGIGKNLRCMREGMGLTQGQLAAEIGVTAAAVGNYELDVSFPRAEVLYRLFDVLDCQPNQFFEGCYTAEISSDEEISEKFRRLDEHGRELVNACLDIELRRCECEQDGILIAARNGGAPRRMALKKRPGAGSLADKPTYKGGRR